MWRLPESAIICATWFCGGHTRYHGHMKRPVVAAAIIDDPTNPSALLAAARAYPPQLRGQWELPGGKVDATDATYRQALLREIDEELNITVTLGQPIDGPEDGLWPILDKRMMKVWLAYLPDHMTRDNPRPAIAPGDSHLELRWVGLDDIQQVPWLVADIPIVTHIATMLLG